MLELFRTCCALIVFGLAAIPVSAQSDWTGSYRFSEDGGKTAGGAAIFIQHDLEIIKGDDGLIAMLKSNGYQTSRDLVCTAKAKGKILSIYFEDYGENDILGKYEKGELLLTLEKRIEKGTLILVTHWKAFGPITDGHKVANIYFEKIKDLEITAN